MRDDWPLLAVSLAKPKARYFTSPNGCSCKDYVHRRMRTGQHCKHQKALRQALAVIAATNAKWATAERKQVDNRKV